jgi:hypothetical protein
MTRNIGFGLLLLLNEDTKHIAQYVVAAHDGAFLLFFSFLFRHAAESGHGGRTALSYGVSWVGQRHSHHSNAEYSDATIKSEF